MLLSAYMKIFGYSTLKIQCTVDRMNLKNWRGPLAPLCLHPCKHIKYENTFGTCDITKVCSCSYLIVCRLLIGKYGLQCFERYRIGQIFVLTSLIRWHHIS